MGKEGEVLKEKVRREMRGEEGRKGEERERIIIIL